MLQSNYQPYLSTMKKTLYLVALLALASCGENAVKQPVETVATENDPTEVLFNEVMQVHDEVMPKMETIQALKMEVEPLTAEGESAEYVFNELEKADSAMMQWMRDFRVPENIDSESKKTYLETEKIKIENVKTMMLNSIEMAEGFLEENEQE